MTRRSKIWLVVVGLFTALNFAGGVYAAAMAEPLHAGIHVALMLVGAYLLSRIAPGRDALAERDVPRLLTDRLTNLEQAVDAVAIEVERIGEGQRFMTRLFAERRASGSPGEREAEPSELKADAAASRTRRD